MPYRVVPRSVSPRPCLVTGWDVSAHGRVCSQRRNGPAGHLSVYVNTFSILSLRPFACSSVFWPFSPGDGLESPLRWPVAPFSGKQTRLRAWLCYLLAVQHGARVTVSGYVWS